MQNNEICSCGQIAQIACRCGFTVKFFCDSHYFSHRDDISVSHTPISLKQAALFTDYRMQSKLSKLQKIETKLKIYKQQVSSHIGSIQSTQSKIQQTISESFSPILQHYLSLFQETETREKLISKCISDLDVKGETYIDIYKSSKLKGIVTNYEEITPFHIPNLIQNIVRKLGIFPQIPIKVTKSTNLGGSLIENKQVNEEKNEVGFLSRRSREKCEICTKSIGNMIQLELCGHSFHLKCLVVNYELYKVNGGEMRNCPSLECKDIISQIDLDRIRRNGQVETEEGVDTVYTPRNKPSFSSDIQLEFTAMNRHAFTVPPRQSFWTSPSKVEPISPPIQFEFPVESKPDFPSVDESPLETSIRCPNASQTRPSFPSPRTLTNYPPFHTARNPTSLAFFPTDSPSPPLQPNSARDLHISSSISHSPLINQPNSGVNLPIQSHKSNSPFIQQPKLVGESKETDQITYSKSNYKKCPTESCWYVIAADLNSFILDCPKCNKAFCLKCSGLAHSGMTCKQALDAQSISYYSSSGSLTSNSSRSIPLNQTVSSFIHELVPKICVICNQSAVNLSFTLTRCGDRFHRSCIDPLIKKQISSCQPARCMCGQGIEQHDLDIILAGSR